MEVILTQERMFQIPLLFQHRSARSPKLELFQNHSFQKESPNYFQIIWNVLFHNQMFTFGGIIFVLLTHMRGFPSVSDGKLKRNRGYVSKI